MCGFNKIYRRSGHIYSTMALNVLGLGAYSALFLLCSILYTQNTRVSTDICCALGTTQLFCPDYLNTSLIISWFIYLMMMNYIIHIFLVFYEISLPEEKKNFAANSNYLLINVTTLSCRKF